MIGANYDYLLVALDGATLRNEIGYTLAKTIGEAARQTNAKVILGSIFVDLRTWFLEVAGIPGEQVTNGHLDIHVYPPKRLTLSSQAPLDPELIVKADFAYSDKLEEGFSVDDSSPAVATEFAEIYNACGVSHCTVKPAAEYAVGINPMLPIFPACELLDWPKFKDIGSKGEAWSLAVAAVKEIQGLSIHGELGQKASTETTEAGLAAALAAWEEHMIPLDLQEFNRFHHAVKLQSQGREHLRVCLSYGEAEGKPMSALKELLRRVDHPKTITA
ncbi:hypothetical protein F4821DRAFT_248626 [Hypoxylon rubiginosum]|uniref:Uncharacterized protein n=1 Tax=Hypoxylon rubiginosum TaxID=110542 RepID=A0ACC0CMZ3_9PEZI|nr:hypothetical protein F4821DRAFT_248626 [Hypoxylon rubiginosum]